MPGARQGIRCTVCGQPAVKTVDSRWVAKTKDYKLTNTRRRRHECSKGHRFTTYEMLSEAIPKSNGDVTDICDRLSGIITEYRT